MSSRANTFGTYLQTLNVGREAAQTQPDAGSDVDALAKRALQFLAERRGHAMLKELEGALGLRDEQAQHVLNYLVEAGLVEPAAGGDAVDLTSFGRDAMNMFSVS